MTTIEEREIFSFLERILSTPCFCVLDAAFQFDDDDDGWRRVHEGGYNDVLDRRTDGCCC